MPSTTQTTQPATWPEGVIARYLTVGGAHVDITAVSVERVEGESGIMPIGNGLSVQLRPKNIIDVTVTARCQGCPDQASEQFEGLFPSAMSGLIDSCYGRYARAWAQSHAEKCRALPCPAA
ncbi:hypothetical protein [Streptomyces sp. NPDC101166]|uniref:hypothetical protein n=1 Tax=Streptomyces sp. NPDC101166 TaxID=3366120 RepID=UPI0037F6AF25